MTELLQALQELDLFLFDLLNVAGSYFWDGVMATLSSKVFWIPFYVLLLAWLWKSKGWRSSLTLLLLALGAIALSDQTASGVLKPWIQRIRPCRPEAQLAIFVHTVNDRCGGMYGFASSHAANFFAMAMVISRLVDKKALSISVFVVAFLVAYSRIYLGVHYPGDVLAGAVIGCVWGLVITSLYQLLRKNWKKNM